jgi:hypothetical protein
LGALGFIDLSFPQRRACPEMLGIFLRVFAFVFPLPKEQNVNANHIAQSDNIY